MKATVTAVVWLIACSPTFAAGENVYDAVASRLQHDPKLAGQIGKPTPEIQALSWMTGTWTVTATVQAGANVAKPEAGTSVIAYTLDGTWLEIRDTYPGGTQDIGYLTYNPARKSWIALGIDSTGNAVTTLSAGWEGSKISFAGNVMIVGIPVTLRQTMTKISDAAYDVTNEQQMPDLNWVLLDRYEYRRRAN